VPLCSSEREGTAGVSQSLLRTTVLRITIREASRWSGVQLKEG
jgi:hypothetical protein